MSTVQAASSPAATAANLKVANARASDGDFLTKGAGHSMKDADGDYKVSNSVTGATPGSAAEAVSSAVQSALGSLKKGG